jgi:exopolyphosphatase/guanosine-5'-triphosphate,3'-diphosphate pyrophosphatase
VSSDFVAAIDLGSNSFHMIVARIENGHVQILDRLREMVQLAAGLDSRNRLSAAIAAAGARLSGALRSATAAHSAGPPAHRRHQHPAPGAQQRRVRGPRRAAPRPRVEIVSGQEEARLIYLGVAHSVGDVAGQSAGDRYRRRQHRADHRREVRPLHLASLRMGCVSLSRACFADGRSQPAACARPNCSFRLNLEPVREEYLARLGGGDRRFRIDQGDPGCDRQRRLES